MKNRKRLLFICQGAIIAAAYVALTFLASAMGLSSGMIQVRFSEMLCILPMFTPAAIPGLYIGCLLANLLTPGVVPLDMIFGPIATLIGALGTYALRKYKWLAPLSPILSNALIVPFVLAYGYNVPDAIPFMMLTVGIGEVISVGVLGMILYFALYKNAHRIFK
jgi:uncharacterized membrane protein